VVALATDTHPYFPFLVVTVFYSENEALSRRRRHPKYSLL